MQLSQRHHSALTEEFTHSSLRSINIDPSKPQTEVYEHTRLLED